MNVFHRLAALLGIPSVLVVVASLTLAGASVTTGCFGSQATTGGGAFAPSAPIGPASATGDGSSEPSGEAEAPKSYDDTGVSAPPINLPAPVTGRLTTTTPNANMASLIIGDELGAPPGSLVMAVNDSKATASLEFDWKTLMNFGQLAELLIPSAHADLIFPDICKLPYHACAYALAEGAFEFALQGDIGDNVSIGIISPSSGAWLSAVVQRVIPPNVRALPRRVNQVGYSTESFSSKETLYSFMPATGADPKGLVEVMDLATQTVKFFPFIGSAPTRIDVNSGNMKAAVTDPFGNFVAFVDLIKLDFEAPPKMSISNPTDVAISFDSKVLAVTANPDGALQRIMEMVDTASMSSIATITKDQLPSAMFPAGSTVTETTAVDHAYLYTSEWIDLYAFVGNYTPAPGPNSKPYLGFVSKDVGGYQIIGMQELPEGCLPRDVSFDPQTDIMVACGGIDQIVRFSIGVTWPAIPGIAFGAPNPVSDPENLITDPLHITTDSRFDGKFITGCPKNAYVTVRDGDATHPDSVLTMSSTDAFAPSKRSDVGLRPSGLAVSKNGSKLFLSSEWSHSVTTWGIDDLK
ncbi:MAG TPA: hypothetical protein VLJ37_03725 [bacterium]|nr:hypothetical protein [bacterium]